MFAVVEFAEDMTHCAVPEIWLHEDATGVYCSRPSARGASSAGRIHKFAKNQALPARDWSSSRCTILCRVKTFDEALKILKQNNIDLSTCTYDKRVNVFPVEEANKLRKEVEEIKTLYEQNEQLVMLQLTQSRLELQRIVTSSFESVKNLYRPQHPINRDVLLFEENDNPLPQLPVATDAALVELDQLLCKNNAIKRSLFFTLRKLGGTTLKKIISNIIKYLVADSVIFLYTWCGLGNNKPFRELTFLKQLIINAAECAAPTITLSEIENGIIKFFQGAHDRINKFEKRREKYECN